ncbi:pre-rRNA processing protein [Ceratocystis lukuohia]|uniref:Pre-rRNA processing protein n=1 Tax=Ceratocystis lukuohia TaxID=2019550 RepID=A0ABR4MD35_9PEZI
MSVSPAVAGDIPAIPKYTISRLEFRDVGNSAVGADVAVTAYNRHPIQASIPSLAFDVLIPDCNPLDPYLVVSRATTDQVLVSPSSNVTASAHAVIHQLPKSIMRVCPKSTSSPLDEFLHHYMNGHDATVFIRGSRTPAKGTPAWIGALLSDLMVPVPFPSHSFDDVIKDFSLTDVDFTLPDLFAEPGSPEADPKVSGTIHVVAALPKQLNFDINVTNIRASANVSYQSHKFGELHLKKWHAANSTKVHDDVTGESDLEIYSRIKSAPLTITDSDVFSEVIQEVLFGNGDIILDADATVDVKVTTALGEVIIRDVPASGQIPVKNLPGDSLGKSLEPQISELRIIESSSAAITLSAVVNITNPAPYSASIPYINIHLLKNGSVLGNTTLRNVNITRGRNLNIPVSAIWAPEDAGLDARKTGVDLISGYLSSYNTTITAKLHPKSIPACPIIGQSLSNISINATVPRLSAPRDGHSPDDGSKTGRGKGEFIRDATFHLFTSTATFTLVSPLQYDTITLRSVNATAFWNHTEPVGEINYGYSFDAPPGASTTPRLPVDWSVGSVGYNELLGAMGGKLKLDARANVIVAIGAYEETLWYVGRGIGATVRL